MKASRREKRKSNREVAVGGKTSNNRPPPKILWPAIVAIGNGLGLAAGQASGFELGDVNVQSALGQPLRASIAYALAPNESIQDHCIFLRPSLAENGLPTIRNATTSASNGFIRLTGNVPVREPMFNLQLMVDCPGLAHLSRQYVVFVNPSSARSAGTVTRPADVQPAGVEPARARPAAVTPAAPVPRPARAERRSPAATSADTPIRGRNSYRVQPGDTLSGIAQRIGDRDITIWEAVDVIFAANPDAFINNDRNLLRAGAVLVLPDLGAVATGRQTAAPTAGRAAGPAPVTAAAAAAQTPRSEAAAVPAAPARETAPAVPATPEPGNVSTGADSPFVTPIEPVARATSNSGSFGPARETIPDMQVDAARTRPPVVAARSPAGESPDGLSSLAWLGGAGVAIILGLLLFGRRLKDRFGSPDDLPAGVTRRRRSDVDETRIMPARPAGADGAAKAPARAEPVRLDADLGTGSGFDDESDIDVAQDFGFSTSRDLYGHLDMELTEEAARDVPEPRTDIIPPKRFTDTVIVEKEIPPSDDTGEYDLSMIVDATRQPIGDTEDTTKDLKAIQVDTDDSDAGDTDTYTLSRAVDYKILEQDYEDELTATQALNARVLKEAGFATAVQDDDETALAERPAEDYALVDEDLTLQLPDSESTVEMPRDRGTAAGKRGEPDESGLNAEVTTELPAADNDATAEADSETATVDTKKLRAS